MQRNNYINELKRFFKDKPLLTRIIIINAAVFLILNVVILFLWLMNLGTQDFYVNKVTSYLSVPSDISTLLIRPWSIFTYMWVHEGFFHIFFNMIILFFGGSIFLQYFNEKKILEVYVLGGLGGALLFILFFNVFPVFQEVRSESIAYGASASVIAVLIAIASYAPKYPVRFFILPPIKLQYIAIAFIILDILRIRQGNPGGHIAHIGGAIVGWFYIYRYKKGKSLSKYLAWVDFKWISKLFKKKKKHPFKDVHYNQSRPVSDEDYNASRSSNQKQIDRILEKISKSGYDSLTKKEKEILFKASNKK